MSVNSVNSTASANTGISSALSSATGGQNLGEQDFLHLLVTQLTNQDPLNPQDQNAFLAQLAQYSTVEGVNNLQAVTKQQDGLQLLGKTIQASVSTSDGPRNVVGQVTSIRFASDGVHLNVKNSDADIKLDNISYVGQ